MERMAEMADDDGREWSGRRSVQGARIRRGGGVGCIVPAANVHVSGARDAAAAQPSRHPPRPQRCCWLWVPHFHLIPSTRDAVHSRSEPAGRRPLVGGRVLVSAPH